MDTAAFDAYAQQTIESWHCPGAAIAILQGDDVIYKRAFGLRDVEAGLPMTEDSRFAIASITKSFTAASVALLVDEGKIGWDVPVCEYMPEFILADPTITRHVTVRDMLSHRTGMPRHDSAAWRLDLPVAEFIKRMRHLKFSAGLREKFQYNNLMYAATGYLVEKVSGQKWQDFVHERVFTPLGMDASNFGPEPRRPGHPVAMGYRVDRDEEGRYVGLTAMPFGPHTELSPGAYGGIFSTLSDLACWLRLQVNAGAVGDFRLVSEESIKETHAPQMLIPVTGFSKSVFGLSILAYGMGWITRPYGPDMLVSHDGNVEGHSLVAGFLPDAKIGIAVLTNAAASHVPLILLREAADRMLGLPAKDWNGRIHEAYDPALAAVGKGKQTSAADRLPDAPHSHPIEDYLGANSADGYPDFVVKMEDGKLKACIKGGRDWSDLRHYHYNVFEWHGKSWDGWSRLRFETNDAGEIDSVSIPFEPAVEDIVFRRKALDIDRETLECLAGEYDPRIGPQRFLVVLRAGRIYWQQPGSEAVEAVPCHVSDDRVEFRIRRSRAVFHRRNGRFSHVVLKTPEATYEAARIEDKHG